MTWLASANARSVASRSPKTVSTMTLPGTSSHARGAPSSRARSECVTQGSSSYATSTVSTASSASSLVSATTIATASPTWRTLSVGRSQWGPSKILPPPGPVSFMSSLVEGRGLCGIGPRRSAAQSAPLYTFRTPGIARARAASMRTRRACGWGERTIAAWACRAMLKSSANRPAPVRSRRSSLRRSGSPIAPAATPSGLPRSLTARLLSCAQMLSEEIDRKRERPVRFGLAVGLAPVARESVIGAGVLVDRHQGIRREPALEQLVHFGLHPAVLHRHVQHEGPVQVLRLADVVLYIRTVIGDRTVDVGAAAHQIAQLAPQAISNRSDLA